jgi:DNA primase
MFPVFDLRGQVAAFSGRALGDGTPKYKNSAETPLYQKRGILYGAHLARKSEQPYWILAEGNVDVFMLHQAGFDSAVATCGTAITDIQARLIVRHVKELFIAYDADAAGQNATQKAVGIAEAAGLRVRVLHMRGAKDPDDFLRMYGAEGFQKLLAESENHIEYRLSLIESRVPTDTDAGKIEFLKEAVPFLAALPTQGEREVYSMRVGAKLGLKKVSEDVEAARKKLIKTQDRKREKDIIHIKAWQRVSAGQAAEEEALAALFRIPDMDTTLTEENFTKPENKRLFINRHNPMGEETASLYAGLMARYEDIPVTVQSFRDCERRLRTPGTRMSYYRNDLEEEQRSDGLCPAAGCLTNEKEGERP